MFCANRITVVYSTCAHSARALITRHIIVVETTTVDTLRKSNYGSVQQLCSLCESSRYPAFIPSIMSLKTAKNRIASPRGVTGIIRVTDYSATPHLVEALLKDVPGIHKMLHTTLSKERVLGIVLIDVVLHRKHVSVLPPIARSFCAR